MIFSLPHHINWCSIPYKPMTVQFLSVLALPRLPRTRSCLTDQLPPLSPSYAATAPSNATASASCHPMPPPLHLSYAATTATPPHSLRCCLCIMPSLSVASPLPCATVLQLMPHSPPRANLQPIGSYQRKTVPPVVPSASSSHRSIRRVMGRDKRKGKDLVVEPLKKKTRAQKEADRAAMATRAAGDQATDRGHTF
jgi:hypothetical protein